MSKKILINSLILSFGILLGRFSGYIRELVIAYKFEVSKEADNIILMLNIPDLLNNLLAARAVSAILIPLLSKEKDIDGYVVDEKSGRRIEFITDQPIVVFYTGNYLEGVSNYPKHYGFCLETQDYPDIANLCPENMKIYSTENIYTQKTTYLFK